MADETVKIELQEEGEINHTSDKISWQIEERPMAPSSEWLWALAIISFAIVIFSLMLKNYLLIVIVFLAAFIVYALKNKTPELRRFRLDNEGLYIEGKLYLYGNFESFWIFPDVEIAFRKKHHFMPLLIIPFHSYDEPEIRKILESRLPESEEEESFLDLLRKKLF